VSRIAATGIATAILAIALVSQERSHGESADVRATMRAGTPPGLGLALLSGVAIGIFFLALARTTRTGGMWPLVAARTTSVVLFAIIAIGRRASVRMPPRTGGLALIGGALDMTANALYLVSTRYGALSITATLASLYPASTIVLARVVLGERLSPSQDVGIACALIAIVLIVAGGTP
jgi:drug/metabolite transporter (DMT)-like permease